MWPLAAQVPWLLLAGVVAGTASASGAIGSLFSYPALLLVGLAPVTANVTNAVAVTLVGVGAVLRSKPELQAVPRVRMARWAAGAAVGGGVGAVLLLVTSSGVFRWVVPFLILLGVGLFVLQPRLRELPPARRAVFPLGLVVVAGYEGYFGAGAGVMMLALVLLTVDRSLPHANAIKNGVLGVADATAGLVFVATGSVAWTAFVPLAVGYLGGGLIGPAVARRIRPVVLRIVVGCVGTALAAVLLTEAVLAR